MSDSPLLTREQILGIKDITATYITIAGWGRVKVRSLTAAERDAYDAGHYVQEKDAETGIDKTVYKPLNTTARLVCKGLIDADNNPLMKEEDAIVMGTKNPAKMDLIANKIRELSGMTASARANLEKNSGSGQNEASPST